MTNTASLSNGYSTVYGKHFNTDTYIKNLDHHQKPWYASSNVAEDSSFSSTSSGSPMSDEHFFSCEVMSEEPSYEPEFRNGNEYSRSMRRDFDWNLNYCPNTVSCLAAPTSSKSCIGVVNHRALAPESFQNHLASERSIDILSPPASPIFQTAPSQVGAFSDRQIIRSSAIKMSTTIRQHDRCLRQMTFDEITDGSFLFITTNNLAHLIIALRERGLSIQDIGETRIPRVVVVLFKTHKSAKRAFIAQKEIGMRMEPPSYTKMNWFKNPGPKFHVVFETSRRLTVKSGKSSSSMKLGDFLMTDARNGRGCLVLADQMKGHRMRVVGYIGKFKRKDGIIIEQKSVFERKQVGWISTKCCKTSKNFVVRKSMNKIEDYLYNDVMQAVE